MKRDPSQVSEPSPFLDLIHDVGPDALRLATYWIGQPSVAEDIVQEAVAKALFHQHRLVRIDNPGLGFWVLSVGSASTIGGAKGASP